MEKATEQQAANILLKRGVPVPVTAPLFFRIFGKKTLKLVVKSPKGNTLIRVANKYLEMNTDILDDIALVDGIQLLSNHGRIVSEVIALCILNDEKKFWRHKILARFINKRLDFDEQLFLFQLILIQGGVMAFINTIRLIKETRITKPMNLSPTEKMS